MQSLRYAARVLGRAPGFTAVAVLILGLGIGANAAVFSIVNALVLRPLPGRAGELVGVFNRERSRPDSYRAFSYPAYADIRDRTDLFEGVFAHNVALVGMEEGDSTRRVFAAVVSSNYFPLLGAAPIVGRGFLPEEEQPGRPVHVAIASYDTWRRSGFSGQFLGSTIKVNATAFTVIGVAPEGFGGTLALLGFEWWFPLSAYDQVVVGMFREGGAGSLADRDHRGLLVAGILKPAITSADAQARLEVLAASLGQAYPDTDRDRTFVVAPLQRLGISSSPGSDGNVATVSALLLLMSTLVLVVACLNLANLMFARGAARRREIAVRLALGGSRTRIVGQLMIEALLLSAAGAVAGVVVAGWTTSLLATSMARAFPIGVTVNASLDFRVLAAAAGFAALSTLLFALGPAWSSCRTDLVPDLRVDVRTASLSRSRLSRLFNGPALVIGQLAVSLALVVAGGLFMRSALRVTSIDAGFPVDRQLVVAVDPSLAGYDETRGREVHRALLERLRALPGIEGASTASTVAFGDMTEGRRVAREAAERPERVVLQVIGADYFKTLGLRMLRGREFALSEEAPGGAARFAIIDEPLARRLFGADNPLGLQLLISRDQTTPPERVEIVGVAPGLRHNLFDPAPVAHLYLAFGSEYRSVMNFHVRVAPGVADGVMFGAIRGEIRRLDPGMPIVTMRTMAGQRDASVQTWALRTAASLFTAFGTLALILAGLGVYGLESYDVARRTREIGIRLALGARPLDIFRLVLGDAGRAAAWGLAIGLLLALGVGRLVSGILFGVSPYDPVVLAAGMLTLAAATLLACYVPLKRATGVEPSEALRSE
jgi:predicted permease